MGVAIKIPKHRISSEMPHRVLEAYPDDSIQFILFDTRLVYVYKFARFSSYDYWRTINVNLALLYRFLAHIQNRVQYYEAKNLAKLIAEAIALRDYEPEYGDLPEGLIRYLLYIEYLLYLCKRKMCPRGNVVLLAGERFVHCIHALADAVFGEERFIQTIYMAYFYNKINSYMVRYSERRLRDDSVPCLWYTKTEDYTCNLGDALRIMKQYHVHFTRGFKIDSSNVVPVRLDRQYTKTSSFLYRVPREFVLYMLYLMAEPYSLCMHLQTQVPTMIEVATALERIVHMNIVLNERYVKSCTEYVNQHHIDYEFVQYSDALEIDAESADTV